MRQKLTNVVFCKLGTGNVSLDAFIHMFVNQDGIRGISSHYILTKVTAIIIAIV